MFYYRVAEWAKEHGYRWFDLGGTDRTRLEGLDDYKRSYGGSEVHSFRVYHSGIGSSIVMHAYRLLHR